MLAELGDRFSFIIADTSQGESGTLCVGVGCVPAMETHSPLPHPSLHWPLGHLSSPAVLFSPMILEGEKNN